MLRPRYLSILATGITTILIAQTAITDTSLQSSLLSYLRFEYTAIAQPQYRPSRRTPRRTQGTGARGCVNESQAQNQLSAPILLSTQTNQTTLGHPTFFWELTTAVPDSTPIEFALVEPNNPQPIYVKRLLGHPAGLVALPMPEDKPELVVGKTYRWSVALICNELRRSSDVISLSTIQRIEVPTDLSEALAHSASDVDTAKVYDEYGFWADSMTILARAKAANPSDQAVLTFWQSMIDQTDEPQPQGGQP